MKKYLLAVLLLAGCNSPKADNVEETGNHYVIKIIDGCEYIEVDYGFGDMRVYSLTHKGNCKFCTQRNKQDTIYRYFDSSQDTAITKPIK